MQLDLTLTEPQDDFVFHEATYPLFVGGFGCVHGDTLIATQHGYKKIKDITNPELVVAWNEKNNQFELSLSGGAFPKGKANLYRVVTQQGEFVASGHHRLLSSDGTYQCVEHLAVGQSVKIASHDLLATNLALIPKSSHVNDEHCFQTHVDLMGSYADEARLYGQQLLKAQDSDLVSAPLLNDAQQFDHLCERMGDQVAQQQKHSRHGQLCDHKPKQDCFHHEQRLLEVEVGYESLKRFGRTLPHSQPAQQSLSMSMSHRLGLKSLTLVNRLSGLVSCAVSKLNCIFRYSDRQQTYHNQLALQCQQQKDLEMPNHKYAVQDYSYNCSSIKTTNIISITQIGTDVYYDMQVLDNNNYVSIDGCIHHNSGKSEALFKRTIIQKLKYKKLNQGYFAPTHDLVKLIAFPRISNLLTELGLKFDLNKSDKIFTIKNYGQIICRSMDNPDSIVGFEIADAVVDELDTLKKEHAENAWNKIIARCRQPKNDGLPNTAAVGTTPEGFRFCYDRWVKNGGGDYQLVKAPTMSNPYIPQSYIDSLRATYNPKLLSAYLDGEFVNLTSGAVYPDFDRQLNASFESVQDGDVLHVGMDFNVLKMAAVVYVIRDSLPHAVDELVGVRDTPTMAVLLKERYPNHKICIYPDAAGQATSSKNSSESDHAILRQHGFTLYVNGTNPAIKDRLNAMNSLILNSQGERRYFVNPLRCPELTGALEQQVYDKFGMPDKASGVDHVLDAGGYFIAYKYPVIKPVTRLRRKMRMGF